MTFRSSNSFHDPLPFGGKECGECGYSTRQDWSDHSLYQKFQLRLSTRMRAHVLRYIGEQIAGWESDQLVQGNKCYWKGVMQIHLMRRSVPYLLFHSSLHEGWFRTGQQRASAYLLVLWMTGVFENHKPYLEHVTRRGELRHIMEFCDL
jgi:hypothetical protein